MHNSNDIESRRNFLKGITATLSGVTLGANPVLGESATPNRWPSTPASSIFTAAQARILRALGEAMVPGSIAAGLVDYLEVQIKAHPADSMLMAKYLGVTSPYGPFYRKGLVAANRVSSAEYGRALEHLQGPLTKELLSRMLANTLPGWKGPAAPLFYLALRADAVDVTYGTQAGFDALGVPYMAHIEPPSRWGP